MIAAVTGLAAIMHASAVAFSIIKWLGVAYLLYLAWKTFRDKSVFAIDTEPVKAFAVAGDRVGDSGQHPQPQADDLLLRVPAAVRARRPRGAVPLMVYLSAVFMAVTLVVFSVYGVFAAAVRRKVFSRPRIVAWVRRSFAATYLVLAGRLAAQTR